MPPSGIKNPHQLWNNISSHLREEVPSMEISYKRRCMVNTRQGSSLQTTSISQSRLLFQSPYYATTSFLRKLSSYRGRDRSQYRSEYTGPPPYTYPSYPHYPATATAAWPNPYSAHSTVLPSRGLKQRVKSRSKSRSRMADTIGKWAPGSSYGPVLSQTDLYLLNPELDLNPILSGNSDAFQLQFNLQTGLTGGFNAEVRDRELPFTAKDEPATLPRVAELIIITEHSPWCTIIKNPQGVTLNDVCQAVWKEYTENYVTDKEFESLTPRVQEHIKRLAAANAAQQNGMYTGYFSPANVPSRFRRVDWLRDKVYFERLIKKDPYIKNRLGYTAPNIYVMALY